MNRRLKEEEQKSTGTFCYRKYCPEDQFCTIHFRKHFISVLIAFKFAVSEQRTLFESLYLVNVTEISNHPINISDLLEIIESIVHYQLIFPC